MDPFQLVLLRSTPTMQGNHVGEAQLAHPRERASCQVHQGEGDMGRVMPTMASAPGPPSPSEQGKRSEVDLLLPAPQFLQRLREERSRSDRSGRPFSLVLIPAPATGQPEEEVDLFYRAIQALARTVRLSDILGWYQGDRIGLILPDTSEAQAWQVVDRLAGSLGHFTSLALRPPGRAAALSVIEYPKALEEGMRPRDGANGDGSGRKARGPGGPAAGDERLLFLRKTNLSAGSRGRRKRGRMDRLARRSLDLVLASVGLVLASPIMAGMSLVIKVTSSGPVLFTQKRLGKGGREFTFLKFRTMHHNCDQTVHQEYVTRLIQNQADVFEMNGESWRTRG